MKIVKYLIESECLYNQLSNGESALKGAARWGQVECVNYLVNNCTWGDGLLVDASKGTGDRRMKKFIKSHLKNKGGLCCGF